MAFLHAARSILVCREYSEPASLTIALVVNFPRRCSEASKHASLPVPCTLLATACLGLIGICVFEISVSVKQILPIGFITQRGDNVENWGCCARRDLGRNLRCQGFDKSFLWCF